MATSTAVRICTVVKDTTALGGKENKFYRTYELSVQDGNGTWWHGLGQYGSARSGLFGGRALRLQAGEAANKIRDKRLEGYDVPAASGWKGHSEAVTVAVPEAVLHRALLAATEEQRAKALVEVLEEEYRQALFGSGRANLNKSPDPEPPAAEPAGEAPASDRIAALNERALRALTLVAGNPALAITQYALLSGELDVLETDLRKVRSYLSTLEALLSE